MRPMKPQALLHNVDADKEPRGDLLLAQAPSHEVFKGPELVERVKRRVLQVLGKAVFVGETVGTNDARPYQQLERAIAAFGWQCPWRGLRSRCRLRRSVGWPAPAPRQDQLVEGNVLGPAQDDLGVAVAMCLSPQRVGPEHLSQPSNPR